MLKFFGLKLLRLPGGIGFGQERSSGCLGRACRRARDGRRAFRDRNATNRLATGRRSLDCSNAPPWCPKRVMRMEKFLLPEPKTKESSAKKQ